jgi:hypothetical protein
MQKEKIPSVYLSYFGTAMPSGYGIDYWPLPSRPLLPPRKHTIGEKPPQFMVVSPNNLHEIYIHWDLFKLLRTYQPDLVLGHSLFVYDLNRIAIRFSAQPRQLRKR